MEIRIRRSDADRAAAAAAEKQRFDVSPSSIAGGANVSGDVSKSILQGVSRSRRRRRRNRGSNEELLIGEEQVIRWEKILPRRFLRVLLVENDDSTRHIVAALLRKCNYQVSAVADGLKAWTVLKEKHYNFDLVLTEVVMPSLSGISLLSKIMSNEIFKTIPVIMMSSNDSIGVVFKCMLKGASDFLVKPVRKNELRNLWQHVWRKYSSGSCGDASENGNGNQTNPETVFENDVASNHGSTDAGSRSRTGDGSDKRSGIQSSCREAEMEIDSGQKPEEPIETRNRIVSEDTNTELEKHAFNMSKATTPSGHEEGKMKDMFIQMETEVALSIHRVNPTEKVWGADGPHQGTPCTSEYPASGRSNQHASIDAMNKLPKEIIDFIGAATTKQCGHRIMGDNDQRGDILNASAKSSVAKWNVCSSTLTPLLELSLRRPPHIEEEETLNTKHVLNHSVASAFSRYKNATYDHLCPRSGSSSTSLCTRTNECGNSNPGNYSSAQNGENILSPLIERAASIHGAEVPLYTQISYVSDKQDVDPRPSVPLRGKVPLYKQISYVSDKDVDPQPSVPLRGNSYQGITSITKELSLHPQFGSVPFTIPIGAIPFPSMCTSYDAILQPIFYPEASVPISSSVEGQKDTVVIPCNPSARNSNYLINNFQCHNYVNHLEQGMEVQRAGIKSSYTGMVLQPPVEKVSLGSHHSCVVTIASGSNGGYGDKSLFSNRGTALDIGNDDELQTCNGKESECDRSRREAALNKFRMKRKDRCFEKKVRYHNRKKLAEQRPRLKGQFVRQTITEPTTKATETAD